MLTIYCKTMVMEMAYQQEPDSILWIVRDDGVLLGVTYLREQQVLAWHRHDTDGHSRAYVLFRDIP